VQVKVRSTINRHHLFAEGDTIVVAVSGGADSVALLDILSSLADLHLDLIIAHLNHKLRGAESDGDEAFVSCLAGSYGLPAEISSVDVAQLARDQRLSLEEAGRTARYRFFGEVARRYGAQAIATAHHADDQAETVLMRLLRGTGASGLRAIAPKSGNNVVRPLLAVTRGEILAYLHERGLSYRTDSSNADTGFLRNRIRHKLLPSLESYNTMVRERLAATATALARDEEVLETCTEAAFGRHGRKSDGRVTIDVVGCMKEQEGIRFRLYRRAILLARGSLTRISATHLQEIDLMASAPKPHLSLSLPEGTLVSKCYNVLSFASAPCSEQMPQNETRVEGLGEHALPGGYRLIVEEALLPGSWEEIPRHVACFDADVAPFPWIVRPFRAGDRIVPLGMTGHKKVKDVFIDAKVPMSLRRRIPLLFCGERLLWIAGVRRSGEASLSPRTRKIVRTEIVDLYTSMDL
jgi:tRNA(Ile)-lysidine synthase